MPGECKLGSRSGLIIQVFQGRVMRGIGFCALRERELELMIAMALRRAFSPRRELSEKLWPAQTRESAASALRTTVHRLRRQLSDDSAIVHEGDYRLAEHVEIDVERAQSLLAGIRGESTGDRSAPAALEELFGGFKSDLPPMYAKWPWFDAFRLHLIELRRDVCVSLMEHYLRSRNLQRAAQLAEYLLGFDRDDETAAMMLVLALINDGRLSEARRKIRALGSKPSPELLALIGEDANP